MPGSVCWNNSYISVFNSGLWICIRRPRSKRLFRCFSGGHKFKKRFLYSKVCRKTSIFSILLIHHYSITFKLGFVDGNQELTYVLITLWRVFLMYSCNKLYPCVLCDLQREEGLTPASFLLLPGPSRCLPPPPPPTVPPAPPLSDPPVRERPQLYWVQQLRLVLLPHVTLHQRPTAHLM